MSNTAFSMTYSFTSIKLRFSDQKRALNLLSLGSPGLSSGSLGAFSGSLGAASGSLGLSQALLGSSKIIAKNSTGSPQGDPDLFFAMIFEHFFFSTLKIPCKKQYRIDLGRLGGVFGAVLGFSRIGPERSWLCLGHVLG